MSPSSLKSRKRPSWRWRAGILCALAVSAAAFAQPEMPRPLETPIARAHTCDRAIALCGGLVHTDGPTPALERAIHADRAEGVAARRLIQLDGPMTPQRRQAMRDVGLIIEQCVGGDAFLVRTGAADPDGAANLDFVRWHARLAPEWKIDPRIGRRPLHTPPRRAIADTGRVVVDVSFASSVNEASARRIVASFPGAETAQSEMVGENAVVSAIVDRETIDALAQRAETLAIQEHPEPTLRNNTTRWLVQSASIDATPFYDEGVTGAGQIVGVIDGRIDSTHCSFSAFAEFGPSHRKIQAYNAPLGANDHGTHVAGIAVGDAGAFDDRRGVAFDGRLVFSDLPSFLSESLLLSTFELHHDQGARVHTNSWGIDEDDSYNAWARAVDVFSWSHEDDLVLFAVSNRERLGSPENAKNCIAVAATRDAPQQELHGSGGAGPTIDGRRKPELFAPGVGIVSADAFTGCAVQAQTGTSMAAPAVAGAAMLTRQYFQDGFYPTGVAISEHALTPSGALLRAVLLNAGRDMAGVAGYPSFVEGWGRLVLEDALPFAGDPRGLHIEDVRRFDDDALETGDVRTHEILVESAGEELRVTLVFTDAPAAPAAAFAPVNDLDLEVIDPDGDVYRGNVFASGESLAGGAFDSGSGLLFDPINNVEQLRIAAPEPGLWTVRIHAAAVNVGPSGYALASSGDIAQPEQAGCSSDFNADGVIDPADLAMLLQRWGSDDFLVDLNADGVVGSADLAKLLGDWGPCSN